MKETISHPKLYLLLCLTTSLALAFLYIVHGTFAFAANLISGTFLAFIPIIVAMTYARKDNISFVLWVAVSMVGILTVFLSAFTKDVTTFFALLEAVHKQRLPDLYLLAVILSATATADAYELACTAAVGDTQAVGEVPSGGQPWAVLFALNLVFLVCTTFLTSRIFEWCGQDGLQSARSSEAQSTLLLDPKWTVWVFVTISLFFGAIFKYNLGKR